MSDISNPSHGDGNHKLIGKRWQLGLEQSHDVAVAESCLVKLQVTIGFVLIVDDDQLRVEDLEHAVGETGLMTWSVMTLITTFDVTRVDEIEEGRKDGQTLSPESRELLDLVLVLVHEIVHKLELELPGHHL